MSVEIELVRALAAVLDETQLTEIEVEDGDRKVRVARKAAPAAQIAYAAIRKLESQPKAVPSVARLTA